MNISSELIKLYNLELEDFKENLSLRDKETDAFCQGILFGLRMSIEVAKRGKM